MTTTKKKPIAELRQDLVTTQADVNEVVDDHLRYLMAQSPNAGFSVGSEYAFQCSPCKDMGFQDYYKLTKRSVGPGLCSRVSDVSKITVSNRNAIVPLKDLESEPEFSSHLNFTKDGLVCDHCYDTIYSE